MSTVTTGAAGGGSKGLKKDALSIDDDMIMALAGSGPTQTIAGGHQRLSAGPPIAGARCLWVGRSLNPH